jgi:iron complex transport system ATP-binding protein
VQERKLLLATRALAVRAGARQLVMGLDLELVAGEIIALLGPNGSGKTLSLQTLAGLRPADGGLVLLEGERPLPDLGRRAIARALGFLPQDPGTEIVGTVNDYIALGLYPLPGARWRDTAEGAQRVQAALQRLDLEALATQDVRSLSGGERRRLDLALLLVQGAPLWLLDEPTNHLDPRQQAQLLGLLREHRDRGGSALVSLHDVSLAADIADRVLLLHGDGRWLCGAAADLLNATQLTSLYGTALTLKPRFVPV